MAPLVPADGRRSSWKSPCAIPLFRLRWFSGSIALSLAPRVGLRSNVARWPRVPCAPLRLRQFVWIGSLDLGHVELGQSLPLDVRPLRHYPPPERRVRHPVLRPHL